MFFRVILSRLGGAKIYIFVLPNMDKTSKINVEKWSQKTASENNVKLFLYFFFINNTWMNRYECQTVYQSLMIRTYFKISSSVLWSIWLQAEVYINENIDLHIFFSSLIDKVRNMNAKLHTYLYSNVSLLVSYSRFWHN